MIYKYWKIAMYAMYRLTNFKYNARFLVHVAKGGIMMQAEKLRYE